MKQWLTAGIIVAGLLMAGGSTLANGRTDDPIGVAVSPQMLLLGYQQSGSVTVHTSVPLVLVARSTVALNGIPALFTYADSRGNLVAKFSETAVKGIVAPPQVVLTLTGLKLNGEAFEGSDTVSVSVYSSPN